MEAWKREKGVSTAVVTSADIAQVVSKLTGVPVTELTEEEKQKLLTLEDKLHQRVVGQKRSRSGSERRGSFVACWTDNRVIVQSQTFLAQPVLVKQSLLKPWLGQSFGNEDAMIRIDMSEYMERHAVSRLVGALQGTSAMMRVVSSLKQRAPSPVQRHFA